MKNLGTWLLPQGRRGPRQPSLAQLWNLPFLGRVVLQPVVVVVLRLSRDGECVRRALLEAERLRVSPWRRFLFLRFTGKGGDKARKTLWSEVVIQAFLLAET